MPSQSLSKISRLSAPVQERISQSDVLSELDNLDENFGIKSTIILVDLLLGDLNYGDLSDFLQKNYGFNQFLADNIKADFGELIEKIGKTLSQAINQNNQSDSGSKLTFSREDEEEVKKYREASTIQGAVIDYDAQAGNIMNQLSLDIADGVLQKRLQNILVSWLKDIRDDLETKDNLMRGQKVGGMGFSETQAEEMLRALKKYDLSPTAVNPPASKTRMPAKAATGHISIEEEDGLPVIKLPQDNLPMDLAKDLPVLASEETPRIDAKMSKRLPSSNQNDKIKVEIAGREMKASPASETQANQFSKLPPPSPAPYVANANIPETVLNSKTANKPNLDDVRFEKRLMGPIEELDSMTLIDFRRLAADPQIAVNKIKEKIDLLEKEGFSRKIEGINAWHRNEVNKFYRLLGQAAMTEGKSLEDIIKSRLLANKPTLSIDELHAVIELNRALRF